MKIESIDVKKALDHARALIEKEKGLSSSLLAALEILLLLVQLLLGRTTLNSKKSSKPPSADPNRLRSTRQKSTKLSGAQVGHIGKTLEKTPDPDFVEVLSVDRRTLSTRALTFWHVQVYWIDVERLFIGKMPQDLQRSFKKLFSPARFLPSTKIAGPVQVVSSELI